MSMIVTRTNREPTPDGNQTATQVLRSCPFSQVLQTCSSYYSSPQFPGIQSIPSAAGKNYCYWKFYSKPSQNASQTNPMINSKLHHVSRLISGNIGQSIPSWLLLSCIVFLIYCTFYCWPTYLIASYIARQGQI